MGNKRTGGVYLRIRKAKLEDGTLLLKHDMHIQEDELYSLIKQGRVLIAEDSNCFIGWLRWGLFWDNTPFMNMLYLLDEYRNKGYGKELVYHWENSMKENGYHLVMTSTLSSEQSQYFYRKLNYVDSGSLLLKKEPLEIIFTKEIT